jgi:hypothetical protein
MEQNFNPHWYEPTKEEKPSKSFVWAVSYYWVPYCGYQETPFPKLMEKKAIPKPALTDTKYFPAYPKK